MNCQDNAYNGDIKYLIEACRSAQLCSLNDNFKLCLPRYMCRAKIHKIPGGKNFLLEILSDEFLFYTNDNFV